MSVIDEVRKYGGFSIFWATKNQRRACAIERLQNAGKIIRDGGDYPWCIFMIGE